MFKFLPHYSLFWGIKDWLLRLYCGKIWINFMTSEEAWDNYLLLLRVAPPLVRLLWHPATPTNSLAAPSPIYQNNKLDISISILCRILVSKIDDCVYTISSGSTFYPWKWSLSKALELANIQTFKLPLHTYSCKLYKLLPQYGNWIPSRWNPTIYFGSLWKNSSWVSYFWKKSC